MGVTDSVIGCEEEGRGLLCRPGSSDWGPIRGRIKITTFLAIWSAWGGLSAAADTSLVMVS